MYTYIKMINFNPLLYIFIPKFINLTILLFIQIILYSNVIQLNNTLKNEESLKPEGILVIKKDWVK